jgi:hypothetical protein
MSKRILLAAVALLTLVATGLMLAGGAAADTSVTAHHPLYMPDAQNGDKCAWVGYTLSLTAPSTVPGGLNNITGNDGKQYPVQSLWSNDSAGGTGYCAGAGDDFPVTG